MKATQQASPKICEAACYDCLLSYSNQPSTVFWTARQSGKSSWTSIARSVSIAPAATPRSEHLTSCKRLCGSNLEEVWLAFLEDHDYHLPSGAQQFLRGCQTRPDFFYEEHNAAIYVDGPPHDYPERKIRDTTQNEWMEDRAMSSSDSATRMTG